MNSKTKLIVATFAAGLACPLAASANLIVNGDFEAGNTGFSSAYTFSVGNLNAEGTYDIIPDPNNSHSSFASYGDHTTGSGLMMVVNGSSTAGDAVWEQTVAVLPGATYDFAAYLSSAFSTSPAALQFEVNSTVIGTLNASSTTGVWDLFFSTWNSGAATSATVKILNNNTASSGNDFALDDLYFGDPVFSQPAPVPEPTSLAIWSLLGVAGAGYGWRKRKRVA